MSTKENSSSKEVVRLLPAELHPAVMNYLIRKGVLSAPDSSWGSVKLAKKMSR